MGVYTSGTRIGSNRRPSVKLGSARGYEGSVGLHQIMIENTQNDMALFEGVIACDFQEASAIIQESSSSKIQAMNEAFASGLIDKIIGFLKTAYEKIKGLIDTFIQKLSTIVIRDNKKLVDKHRNRVMQKDLSKMPYKWSEPRVGGSDSVLGNIPNLAPTLVGGANAYTKYKLDVSSVADAIQAADNHETKEDRVKNFESKTGLDFSNMVKSFKEKHFKDVEEKEGVSKALLTNIMETLTTSKDEIKSLKESRSKVDKLFKKRLSELKALDKKLSANLGNNKGMDVEESNLSKDEVTKATRGVNNLFEAMKFEQESIAKNLGAIINAYKFKIKESRSVFARAVTYSGLTEDTDYEEPEIVPVDDEKYVDDVEGTDEVHEEVDELDSIDDIDVESDDAESYNESDDEEGEYEVDDLDSLEDVRDELIDEEADGEESEESEVDVEDEELLDAVDEAAAHRLEELFEGVYVY